MVKLGHSLLTLSFLTFSLSAYAGNKLDIAVTLVPAGSFVATTPEVSGYAYKTADGVAAEDVTIDLRKLKTGVGLRDKHTKARLLVDQYPQAKLIKASGANGKGTAVISVAGKEQTVEGTYRIQGDSLKAEFPMKLSSLEITDVSYMGIGVKDTVKVTIEVPIQVQSSSGAEKRAKRN